MTMKLNSVVVTGATGMIGSALIRKLLHDGCYIYAAVRPDSERNKHIPDHKNVEKVFCGLDELEKLPDMIHKTCDGFFHLGWKGTYGTSRNAPELQTQNITASLKAVRSAKALGCKVFVGAGSQAEYGRVSGLLTPETPAFPENDYGAAKLCAGTMTRLLCQELGIRHVWCRILSVYGPYDGKNTMIMSAVQHFLNNEKMSFTPGEQLWDYLYCDDAAEALLLCSEKGHDGAVYCIGSGKAMPLREYIACLHRLSGTAVPAGIGERPYPDRQVMYLCADISKLHNDTGFVPRTSFEDGIKQTLAFEKMRKEREKND